MNRLTFKCGYASQYQCSNSIQPKMSSDGFVRGKVIDRLGEYEDTGMTPEEIKQMISYWEDLDDRVKEWLKAYKEERLIVLPLKPGQPIYFDGEHFANHCAGEVFESTDWSYEYPTIYRDFHGEDDFRFDPDDVGSTFFLSKEECEQCILKKYGSVKKSPKQLYEEQSGKKGKVV